MLTKEPRQVQSKSQLQMFYHENLSEFDYIHTHLGTLDIAKIDWNIPICCHFGQGAKTSTKQVQVSGDTDCPYTCFVSLGIAKIERNICTVICGQGAKTSTKQLQLQVFCCENLCDCDWLCTCFGFLVIAKIERNIPMCCQCTQGAKISTMPV